MKKILIVSIVIILTICIFAICSVTALILYLSHSDSVVQEEQNQTPSYIQYAEEATENKITSFSQPSHYIARYEISNNGNLFIRTNINSSNWDGYSTLSRIHFKDGSISYDSQGGNEEFVTYECTSAFAYFHEGDVITRTEFFVFNDKEANIEYFNFLDSLGSHKAAIEALSDKIHSVFDIGTVISIKDFDTPFDLTGFEITYDKTNRTETYTAHISTPIEPYGSYGLIYEPKTGPSNKRMSYIKQDDECLKYTRETNHFASSGATGTFFVTYCAFNYSSDNSIICVKTTTTGFKYEFK